MYHLGDTHFPTLDTFISTTAPHRRESQLSVALELCGHFWLSAVVGALPPLIARRCSASFCSSPEAMLTFLICSVILYSFAVALPTEQETLDKRGKRRTACSTPGSPTTDSEVLQSFLQPQLGTLYSPHTHLLPRLLLLPLCSPIPHS